MTPYEIEVVQATRQALSTFTENKKHLSAMLNKIVKDKTISLDARWQLFIDSGFGNTRKFSEYQWSQKWNYSHLFYYKTGYKTGDTINIQELLDLADYVGLIEKDSEYNKFREYYLTNFIQTVIL